MNESLYTNQPQDYAKVALGPISQAVRETAFQVPKGIHFGAVHWNYPAWRGLVYNTSSGEKSIKKEGLRAYAQWPLFKSVSLERNYFQPYSLYELEALCEQVPETFQFYFPSPQKIIDPYLRTKEGKKLSINPHFLDVTTAQKEFLSIAHKGLSKQISVLGFSLPYLNEIKGADQPTKQAFIKRLEDFFMEFQRLNVFNHTLGLEIKNPELLTPRLMGMLERAKVRPILSLNPYMPSIVRQVQALRYLDDPHNLTSSWHLNGPLIVRWTGGKKAFQSTKQAPEENTIQADQLIRSNLLFLMKRGVESAQNAWIYVGNQAEGCAPKTIEALAKIYLEKKRQ